MTAGLCRSDAKFLLKLFQKLLVFFEVCKCVKCVDNKVL